MSEPVSLLAGHYETTKTDHFTRRLIETHFEFDWIPASAGMTVFFYDMLKNAVLAVEEKCCDTVYAALRDTTTPVIPAKAGIQSERNCNSVSRELRAFFCGMLKNATPAEEEKCRDAAYTTLANVTNHVIPAKAGIQSKRNYNPAWVEMTRILTHKNVSTDFSVLPELY